MNQPEPGVSPDGTPPSVPPPTGPPSTPASGGGGRGIWVGAGLVLAAVVVPILLVLTLVLPQFRLNAQVVPADGAPHSLTLPAGAEYAVFIESRTLVGAPSCSMTGADGATIPLRPVSGSVTVNNRMVLRVFDTGAGNVTVSCAAASGYTEVVVGKYPDMTRLLVGIFGALGFGLVVGGLGVVLLIVALVRRSRRA